MYLFMGDLPWRQYEHEGDDDRILAEKLRISPYDLCPTIPQLGDFVLYARNLAFEARPEYERWRRVFKAIKPLQYMCPHHPTSPCRFEWIKDGQ